MIVGALEPQVLKDQGLKAVAMAARGPVEPRHTYGSFADGTARRVSFSAGVEHIGVLYSEDSMREALDWLNAAFDHHGSGYLEVRGRWLGLLFLGLVVLARPVLGLLPPVTAQPRGAGLRWRRLAPVAIAPAILTPLILWKAPHARPAAAARRLPRRAFHWSTGCSPRPGCGLSASAVRKSTRRSRRRASRSGSSCWRSTASSCSVCRSTASSPRSGRSRRGVPLILAMLVGTLPYVLADEWLTRGPAAPRGAYAFTKLCFLVSLVIAVALNLEKLFFLIIIAVVILLFFVIYGLFSAWTYRATRHPLVGGLSNALAFAWAIAVTFPLLTG